MRRRTRAVAPGCATCGQRCGYEADQCAAITRVRARRARWESTGSDLPTGDGALDTLPAWTGQFPTLAWQIEEWMLGAETATEPRARPRFRVPTGPLGGTPMVLTDRQLLFMCWWYAVDPADGTWVIREGSMRHARGTGKSPLAGALGCIELVGPCRVIRWDGDTPVGGRNSMPLIHIAAVSEAQTKNIMQYVRVWLGKGSPLCVEYDLDPAKQIVYSPGTLGGVAGGSLEVVTSSAATVRGATPSLVLCDEVGEWTDSNHGKDFYDVLADNAAKVAGGRVVACSNTWRPGTGSVAEDRWEAYELEQEAEVPPDKPFLMDVREAPPDVDWSDPGDILRGLTVVYDGVPWITPEQFMPKVLDPARPIQKSQREYGNLRVSDLTTWVSTQGWDQCIDLAAFAASRSAPDPGRDATFGRAAAALADGDEIALFVDPSETDDATAVVACRMSDGLVVPLWVHEPHALDPNGRPFGRVVPGQIDRRVVAAFDRYKVIAFRSDVHPIEQLSRNDWHDRYSKQLVWWSSKTEAVAYDMRSKGLEFAKACGLVAAEIEAGNLRHTGDKVLGRHVGNSQRRPYRLSEFIGIGKGDRARKIDAAVAMIGARDLRRLVLLSDEWRKYDKRRDRVKREKRAIVLK